MSYEFNADWAVHESGTKYYQVIMIRQVGSSRGVVVTHWGKMHPGAPSEPKNHGQYKVELEHTGIVSAKQQAVSNKSKRGYSVWNNRKQEHGIGEFEVRALINDWFKVRDAEDILEFMFGIESADIHDDEFDPFVESRKVVTPTITEKTKNDWGSW